MASRRQIRAARRNLRKARAALGGRRPTRRDSRGRYTRTRSGWLT